MSINQIPNEPEVSPMYQRQPWKTYESETPSTYEQTFWDVYEPEAPSSKPQPEQLEPQAQQTAPLPVQAKRSGRGLRTGMIGLLILLLLGIFSVGLFAGWQFSRSGSATGATSTTHTTTTAATTATVETAQEAAIAKIKAAVTEIDVTTQSGSAIGSGVIIDQRGYIVTNNHVVSGAESITVILSDGTHLPAQLVGTDAADDLAVIKITTSEKLTVATLGNTSALTVGQDVLVIGNPLGINESVSQGIISALGRTVSEGSGGATITNAIQTDAAINPGNSGGALIDLQGNLIGIPTLGAIDTEFNTPANGVGFAIPSSRLAVVVPQLIATGHVIVTQS